MFLKKIFELRNSLSVRLTFWYALIFTLSSLLVLIIISQQIISLNLKRTDEELLGDASEFSYLFKQKGINELVEELAVEAASEDEEQFFIQLLTNNGETIFSSDMASWGPIGLTQADLYGLADNTNPVLKTLYVPTKPFKIRTILERIDTTRIIRLGISLEENTAYLAAFRRLILLLLFPVIVGATTVGWFMAKQALGDVEQITKTAEKITQGNYDERVDVGKKSLEIKRLAHTFNQMVDKLQTLIRGMQEITDNIAHDLRSPLARIRGIAEMHLLGRKSQEGFETMAVSTIEECDKLINLINTMLEITETEAGLDRDIVEDIDIKDLIVKACELFHQIADQKQIAIATDLDGPAVVRTNKAKLQRLFTNLLENAIKYTPAKGQVSILLEHSEHTVRFHVKDTGIGIPPSDLPKIFDRFYRCDASRTESGYGLGLSQAKAIAEALGGTMQVKSTLNVGSEFIFSMPI